MFTACPHCQFLVARDPRTHALPAACTRCGKPTAPLASLPSALWTELGLKSGDVVRISQGEHVLLIAAVEDPRLASGVVRVPAGHADTADALATDRRQRQGGEELVAQPAPAQHPAPAHAGVRPDGRRGKTKGHRGCRTGR